MAEGVNKKKPKKPVKKNVEQRSSRRGIPRVTRDVVLFVSGLSGVFYETVFTEADRPTLLFLFGAMIGLPAFLRTDESREEK